MAAAGFTGVYADANAISPGTARQVRALVEAAGGRYVDGGIIGPPPGPTAPCGAGPGGTRLYLGAGPAGSGPQTPSRCLAGAGARPGSAGGAGRWVGTIRQVSSR